jgi:hypothetical protein
LRTALDSGHLLASKHDRARSIQTSFGAVETHNRVASPTIPMEKDLSAGKLHTRLMPLVRVKIR